MDKEKKNKGVVYKGGTEKQNEKKEKKDCKKETQEVN